MILATVTDAKSMSAAVGGLRTDGRLVVLGASPEAIEVSPFALILGRRGVAGWPSGIAPDSEDTLKFSVLANVRPMIETYPLAQGCRGLTQRMMSGKARFRVVLTP